ncbi:MAG: GAP family protein [Pseudomonadota bacterium]
MTLTFVFALIGIAMVDSLNPTATAIHIYLLSTARTLSPAITFIVGKFITNYLAGFLALLGLDAVMRDWLSQLDPPDENIRLILGILLVAAGYSMLRRKGKQRDVKPKSLHPVSTWLLGVATTLAELPTAAPYWAAIALITQAHLAFKEIHLVLLVYNMIFVLPLVALCGIHLALHKKGQPLLAKLERWISRWFPQILRLALMAIGFLLITDAAVHHLVEATRQK